MTELFSVYQFFPDDTHEQVRASVRAEEAIEAAIHYSTSVGARLGTTRRVIVTDSGDHCCWEWKHDEGIVFGTDPRHLGKLKKGVR
jgi:hypothetical protein